MNKPATITSLVLRFTRETAILKVRAAEDNSNTQTRNLGIMPRIKVGVFGVPTFASQLVPEQNIIPDTPEITGKMVPPTIRVTPGGTIKLHYVNDLPLHSHEQCATASCADMSNLHFHGMHVSPERPQDDVLTMMSVPGQVLNYEVHVPSYAAPGLYWYHAHPHGESARQDLDGISGAIVIEGMDKYYPSFEE